MSVVVSSTTNDLLFVNLTVSVLKSLCRGGWKTVEEVGERIRFNMERDAKRDAHARYLVRYGSIHGKKLEDDLRKYLSRYY